MNFRSKKDSDAFAKRLDEDEGFLQSVIEGIERESPPPSFAAPHNGPRPIQIWHPEKIEGEIYFVRPPAGRLGDHFAARQRIPARKPDGVRRVCWFGESAATGYLYAPWLTPAGLLEDLLNSSRDNQPFEVVDFARTNETLAEMQGTIVNALQLNPDILVIFAGNNWNLLETPQFSPNYPDARARNAYGSLLEESGIYGPIEKGARRRLVKVGAFLASVAQIAEKHNLEVILVVPEVNLADWEERQPAPWLPGVRVTEWHELYEKCLEHLGNENWEKLTDCGEKMLSLDDGCIPTGFYFLQKAMQGLKQPGRALLAAKTARDSTHFAAMCFLGAPRITAMEQEVLRRGGKFHGFGIVDLPEIFSVISGGGIPGRRWFLDYCHLTEEGLQTTAAAVAGKIIAGQNPSSSATPAKKALPSPLTKLQEATVYIGAALHTAHRMNEGVKTSEMVRYWLEKAVSTDPDIIHQIWDVIEMRVSGRQPAFTGAHTRNIQRNAPILYAHGWSYPHLDATVLEEFVPIIKRFPGGAARWDQLCRSAERNEIDLLSEKYYLSDPIARPFYEITSESRRPSRAYFRAFWPKTSFAWVERGEHSLRARICARSQDSDGGRITLRVNAERIADWGLEDDWTWNQVTIPPAFLRKGVNRITIEWPVEKNQNEQKIQSIIQKLKNGKEADVFPKFGELYAVELKRDY